MAALTLGAVVAAACGDGATAPRPGSILVAVVTSGADQDIDGYEVVVDSATRQPVNAAVAVIGAVGTRRVESTIAGITPGTHTLRLEGVADNCTVNGADSRSITLSKGQRVTVEFSVVCAATGVEVTTHTTGTDTPPNYNLLVDQASTPIASNSTQVVSRLRPGPHLVSLQMLTDNCRVVSGDQTVTVSSRTVTPIRFEIACVAVVRLEKIAYVVDTVVNGLRARWIAVMNPDGSGARLIAAGDSPAWSPDGTKLVFSATTCTPFDDYYGISCNGGLVVMDPETLRTFFIDGGSGFKPAWQPGSDVIAFTKCCAVADHTRVYLTRTDGSSTTFVEVRGTYSVSDPVWSPDGNRIAFTCFYRLSIELCVINKDGSGFLQLTDDAATESDPAWSPDGNRIAFDTYVSGTPADIAVISPAGGAVTRLTDGFEPSWSRDGSKLVFDGPDGLYTINADGSHRTRLTKGFHYAPAWRP